MSERACNEAIANMYNDLIELRNLQSDLKNDLIQHITSLSKDIEYIKYNIEDINKNISSCAACKNPSLVIKEIEEHKKEIESLNNKYNNIKYMSIGISTGISMLTAFILLFLKIKEIF